MKSISAMCGHVTRRLIRNEPLEGTVLEFALDEVIGETDDDFLKGIAEKFKAGEKLDDYEQHIVIDVLLLHLRLGA